MRPLSTELSQEINRYFTTSDLYRKTLHPQNHSRGKSATRGAGLPPPQTTGLLPSEEKDLQLRRQLLRAVTLVDREFGFGGCNLGNLKHVLPKETQQRLALGDSGSLTDAVLACDPLLQLHDRVVRATESAELRWYIETTCGGRELCQGHGLIRSVFSVMFNQARMDPPPSGIENSSSTTTTNISPKRFKLQSGSLDRRTANERLFELYRKRWDVVARAIPYATNCFYKFERQGTGVARKRNPPASKSSEQVFRERKQESKQVLVSMCADALISRDVCDPVELKEAMTVALSNLEMQMRVDAEVEEMLLDDSMWSTHMFFG